jgi:predicted dehydrogenase
MRESRSRRTFLKGGMAAALTAASYRRVRGANERVGLGFIGFGLIGKRHVLDFKEQPGADLVAVAETHAGRRDEAAALMGGSARAHGDFRRLLEDRDINAVVVSTPDHWHALMTILACAAGKDVYVEKPTSLFVREGRWMVEAAKHYQRIVQVGTQQRSGPHYQRARSLIRDGHIGRVVEVRMWANRNVMPGFGAPPDGDPPPELDYDLWLGPAPARPYNPNRAIYHFRWFWDYSGGQMTNLGQHMLDIVHWYLGVDGPTTVTSVGGRYALRDNGETPDAQDALFEYPGWFASWSHREVSRGATPPGGLQFCGTRGCLTISRRGFNVAADRKVAPSEAVPRFGGPHPVGGPSRTGLEGDAPTGGSTWTEPIEDTSGNEYDQFRRHAAHFLDCVRERREPISDIESGHRVATACHLANLSLRLGRTLRWDAHGEHVIDDDEANSRLERPYRAPWDAERRAALGTA